MEFFLFLFIIPLAVTFGLLLPIIAIFDILRSKFSGNDNLLMLLIVIFIPFGAIIYFIIAPSKKIPNSNI
jgi:hypothetical protein